MSHKMIEYERTYSKNGVQGKKNVQIDPPRKVFEILAPKLRQRCPHVYFTCPWIMEVIATIFSEYALTKVGGNPKNSVF